MTRVGDAAARLLALRLPKETAMKMARDPLQPNVFLTDDPIARLCWDDIQKLKKEVAKSDSKRVRLCAHRSADESVQEMIIALGKDTYVRPHRHVGKSESFHVIEGEADVVLFRDDGEIDQVVRLGDCRSGACFFFRVSDPGFHTVLVRCDVLIIHETTNGPYRKEDTALASWAPDERDAAGASAYLAKLREDAASWNRPPTRRA